MGFFEAIWDVLSTETAYTAATRFAAVLVFAAVGEWVAERSGTLNISVEAMILTGAFAGAIGYDWTENALVGILMGMIAGLLVSLVQAQMSHRLTADQFVVGLTLNILFLFFEQFLVKFHKLFFCLSKYHLVSSMLFFLYNKMILILLLNLHSF